MSDPTSLNHRTWRAWQFARHIPPAKILRRAALTAKRAVTDRLPALARPSRAPPPARNPNPPLQLLPPRENQLACDGPTLRFTFHNSPRETPRASINWHPPASQLWVMHLHYMDYLETADDALFADLVASWLASQSHPSIGAWRDAWNAYALSIRSIVWMQQLSLRRARLPATLTTAMEASLASQIRYLLANLETDLGGNHLIKNVTALLWASAFFAGPEPDRWRTRALAHLTAQLPLQVLPDGTHFERSPSYHCQVFADLIACRHILGPALPALDNALTRMAQATANFTHLDGNIALFNDAGLTMSHSPGACLDAYASLGHERPAPASVFAHPAAGYYGLHSPQATLVIDCGRMAPDDLPAHGHADIGSFELSVAGHRVIVDQGVYEYLPGRRRDAARATRSHNTLCFESANQADCYGAFRCGRRPNVTFISAVLNGTTVKGPGFQSATAARASRLAPHLIVEASHDGFTHLAGSPTHNRRFDATSTSLTLTDTITGRPTMPAALAFLLHPSARITPTPDGVIIHQGPTTLTLTSTLKIAIEPAVWWPDLGVEHATHRIRLPIPPGTRSATTLLQWS